MTETTIKFVILSGTGFQDLSTETWPAIPRKGDKLVRGDDKFFVMDVIWEAGGIPGRGGTTLASVKVHLMKEAGS